MHGDYRLVYLELGREFQHAHHMQPIYTHTYDTLHCVLLLWVTVIIIILL